MMNQKRQIKYTAQLLVLIYLLLTVFMTIGMERHALKHGRNPNHAAQHTTFTCNWMCAASTFVHTSDQQLDRHFTPYIASLTLITDQFIHKVSVLSYYVRPPPFSLS